MEKYPVDIQDIRIRDPFIAVCDGKYYMAGTHRGNAFSVWESPDLKHWSEPHTVFEAGEGFWGVTNFWAPELHRYKGRWYLFGSAYAEGVNRATQIFTAKTPLGPFVPLGSKPQTPAEWMCLDGTLYVDPKGKPWMVFCHEWVQVRDGEVCAIPLSGDLKKPAGEPILLFRASEAPWTSGFGHSGGLVTDGPFIYHSSKGFLVMLWSSFDPEGRYNIGLAVSDKITGPWRQLSKPLFSEHGGHGMVFRDLSGRLCCLFHCPNSGAPEKANIYLLEEDEHGVPVLGSRLF
ncbi:MAG: family 43 glycosylhydrolase [Abditibacteriota bacterium]|nr:family 43 glycosylhydrolase [Abditibacteriota bacterium]